MPMVKQLPFPEKYVLPIDRPCHRGQNNFIAKTMQAQVVSATAILIYGRLCFYSSYRFELLWDTPSLRERGHLHKLRAE